MSIPALSQSVGRNAPNLAADVTIVQRLLLARGFSRVGDADGRCGKNTLAAIEDFQAGFMQKPDGRIDPGGRSWANLSGSYSGQASVPPTPLTAASSITRTVPRPGKDTVNLGLQPVSNSLMLSLFGDPRGGRYSSHCEPPTDPKLRRNLVLDTVGPFRVTGLLPAVLSLKAVMQDIQAEQPAVYQGLGTAGMLCCRLVRGSSSSISNHSWGTAIDLTLNGVLDVYGDDRVQFGLTLIAPIFNRHGWYWGVSFGKEDGMHFEASQSLVRDWAATLK